MANGAQHGLRLGEGEETVSKTDLHSLAFGVLTVWLQARLTRAGSQKPEEKRQRDHIQRREASTLVEERDM